LTVDLFDEGAFGELLETYDLAHQAGRYIARQQNRDSALALESALHRLRTSDFAHHRHMAVAVPLYLQHLLYEVSERLHRRAFRYDHLIESLLRLPVVHFVTLNYDLLLDRRLSTFHPLNHLSDYVVRDRNWSLIKLHGSVNWYRKSKHLFAPASPPPNLVLEPDISCVSPHASLQTIRRSKTASTNRYPALALPEGPEDELVAPDEHLKYLEGEILAAHQIDLLVIGYSGLDQAALRLLSKTRSDVRRLTIVNADFPSAQTVLERLEEAGIGAVWPLPFAGDFAEWVDLGHLDRLVEEYGGPYRA
jgi:hypothetical protein